MTMMIRMTSTAMIAPETNFCWYILERPRWSDRKYAKKNGIASLEDHLLERARGAVDRRVGLSKLHRVSHRDPGQRHRLRETSRMQTRRHAATHRIPRVLNLFPLAPQIPQDIRSHILRLHRDPLRVVQAPRSVLEGLGASQQSRAGRVRRGVFVGVWVVRRREAWAGEKFGPLSVRAEVFLRGK
jgi:hypothetical protein